MKTQISMKMLLRILTVTILTAFCGCDFLYKNVTFLQIPPQPVSGSVEIESGWIELIPPNPLGPLGEGHSVFVKYDGYEKVLEVDKRSWSEDGTILYLADGRQTRIEVILASYIGSFQDCKIDCVTVH